MSDLLDVRRNGQPADIEGLWAPYPAFLVGGGPSINDVDLNRFRERGVMSMGINQVACWVPVRAWVHSDPQHKFHHGMFIDPAMMTFCPQYKLRYNFFMKTDEGFRKSAIKVQDCPNTYGFNRHTCFVPEEFFTTEYAHWGPGKHQPEGVEKIGTFCTMLLGIRLLYYLGVRVIFLLGVDYCGRDKMCYGFPSDKKERNRRYKKERAMLEALMSVFKRHGVLIYNTYRDSKLDLFDYVPFDEAVDFCKGDIPPEPLDPSGYYSKSKTEPEAKAHPPVMPKHFPVGPKHFERRDGMLIHVEMFYDGSISAEAIYCETAQNPRYELQKSGRLKGTKWKGRWRLHVYTNAKDEKQAVRVADDIRKRIIAGTLPEKGDLAGLD